MSPKPQQTAEIANRIKEGVQRRNEEIQRLRRLKQEQHEEQQENASELKSQAQTGYIPYIFVSLLFLSFPLSEPTVDWILVACFLVLNGLWTCFFRSSSWLNWIILVFSNFSLVRFSPVIPQLPQLIRKLDPQVVAWYVAGNLVAAIILYYAYVERRMPFLGKKGPKSKNPTTSGKNSLRNVKEESLEEFAKRRERTDRIDWAASGILVANMVALVYMDVISPVVLLNGMRQLIALFH